VPQGTGVPASFKSTSISPDYSGPQITFTASNWYSTQLEEELPAHAGYEWAGYVSPWEDNYSSTSGPQDLAATIDLGLPAGKHGKPFAGPLEYEAVVGGQQFTASTMTGGSTTPSDTNVPTACNTAPESPYAGKGYGEDDDPDGSYYSYACVDSTYPSSGFASVDINNAGIVAGKAVSASRGTTKSVYFTFDYVGTALGAPFKLSATTTIHGAKTSVSPAKLSPTGTTSKQVTVRVKVPGGTASGTYKVTLTAKLANGQSRTATAELKVH
jgi:hypothetical protein